MDGTGSLSAPAIEPQRGATPARRCPFLAAGSSGTVTGGADAAAAQTPCELFAPRDAQSLTIGHTRAALACVQPDAHSGAMAGDALAVYVRAGMTERRVQRGLRSF